MQKRISMLPQSLLSAISPAAIRRVIVGLCFLLAAFSLLKQTQAGCSSSSQQFGVVQTGTAERLAEVFWNHRGEARVVYEGGELKFYPLIESTVRCHGPECRGPTHNEIKPAVAIPVQRLSQLALLSDDRSLPSCAESRLLTVLCTWPDEGYLAGILRPPR